MESAHEFPFLLRNWELKGDYQLMETRTKDQYQVVIKKKTLLLGKTEGRRRRGQQRMRWLDGITDS